MKLFNKICEILQYALTALLIGIALYGACTQNGVMATLGAIFASFSILYIQWEVINKKVERYGKNVDVTFNGLEKIMQTLNNSMTNIGTYSAQVSSNLENNSKIMQKIHDDVEFIKQHIEEEVVKREEQEFREALGRIVSSLQSALQEEDDNEEEKKVKPKKAPAKKKAETKVDNKETTTQPAKRGRPKKK